MIGLGGWAMTCPGYLPCLGRARPVPTARGPCRPCLAAPVRTRSEEDRPPSLGNMGTECCPAPGRQPRTARGRRATAPYRGARRLLPPAGARDAMGIYQILTNPLATQVRFCDLEGDMILAR